MTKLSKTQIELITKMLHNNSYVFHMPGGFWTVMGVPQRQGTLVSAVEWVPEWSVGIRTIRSLEKSGLLVRTFKHSQEWKDDRILTSLGFNIAKQYEEYKC